MAQQKSTVKIVEVCKVAPVPAVASEATPPKSLSLTFFDMLWLRLPPIQYLSFYEFPTPENTNTNTTAFFHSDMLPRLKHSLSLTLQHFLPLAGTLSWPESSHKPVVNYIEGDAISFTVAESGADDFYRLTDTVEFIESRAYHPLVPNLALSEDRAALLALQVTLFPNRGFSFGITMHHAVVDGKTMYLFVKSWSHICQSLASSSEYSRAVSLPPELTPFFDRTVIKGQSRLEAIYSKQLLDLDRGPNNRSLMFWQLKEVSAESVRGTFQLTRANIEKLKRQLAKSTNQQLHISTFCLACAYIWVCLVTTGEINEGLMFLCFQVDCRSGRIEPHIPSTYFGNCIASKDFFAETKELKGKHGLEVAVKSLAQAIKNLENDNNSFLNGAEYWLFPFIFMLFWRTNSRAAGRLYATICWVVKLLMSFWHSGITFGTLYYAAYRVLKIVIFFCYNGIAGRIYSVAGSHRFEVYTISDFGWGKPKKVDMVSIERTGAISLCQARNGDGVEVGLVLEKHRMEAFASLFAHGLGS